MISEAVVRIGFYKKHIPEIFENNSSGVIP